jgi:drug/metabolite transporter (DMT)-like permease
MKSAVTFALLSLCFAGLNDVVFKRYSAKDRSRGALVFGIGLVWLLLQALTMLGTGRLPKADSTTLVYGVLAGATLAISNILLIESLTQVEVSTGSTIYRLNTLGVAVLSVLFLHEDLGLTKAAGIGTGVLAVLLLLQPSRGAKVRRGHGVFVGIVVLASLLRAIYGVASKAGLNHGADADTMLLLAAGSWVMGGALYALVREGRLRITRTKTAYALLSGLLVYLIVNFLIAAVARGEASVVIPIANLSFVAAMLISVTLGMETLSARKLTAVGCAMTAIVLLSMD